MLVYSDQESGLVLCLSVSLLRVLLFPVELHELRQFLFHFLPVHSDHTWHKILGARFSLLRVVQNAQLVRVLGEAGAFVYQVAALESLLLLIQASCPRPHVNDNPITLEQDFRRSLAFVGAR